MFSRMMQIFVLTAWATAAIPQEALSPESSFHQYADGLLSRRVHTARDRVTVEIWDLMVGPGKSSARASLPGAAVIEVRSGSGTLSQNGGRVELRLGTALSLAEASEFQLGNASATEPLILRAIIVLPAKP